MERSTISLEHTNRFNRLMLDYVNGDDNLKQFYGFKHDVNNYRMQMDSRKQFPVDRELLANALLKQYESIGGAQAEVLRNIESLREENTFTVTTGHQLNIFTGPLYFVYKILHTIKLADELRKAYPTNHFVPIYWMNTEDHDIEEVGQFNLFGKKYVWETEQTGATGRMRSAELNTFCDQLEEVFSNNPETLALVAMFRTAYSDFGNLAAATRYFSNQLFAKYGLVIIDSDDVSLKRSFTSFFKKDIFDNEAFHLVRNTNQRLETASYHVQVNPREINAFYLKDGVRNRILASGNKFKVFQTDIRFSKEALLAELESHPERFSPNVVLRPLFQEFILPNLAYVGGAGELAYWLQYKDYFSQMGVSFPILSLRNHFLLIDGATADRMEELKLLPEDMFHSIDELIKLHVLEVSDADISLDEQSQLLVQLYDGLKEKASQIDESLVAALDAEQTRMQQSLDQWGSRFTRSLKKNFEVTVNRIRKLDKKLFPNGYLQERHDNLFEFYSKYGPELIDELYEVSVPFSTEFHIVEMK
ncbi:MAG: bacillithiol biosynthesis cysteine-adding enzyme BshC [Flavobacteriales bacterium]|nr:bacillithiol biosynthesis cysteine-adding enzyme BshC [Flavobacteriales bacterium]